MLVITNNQMQVFSEYMLANFSTVASQYLGERYPARIADYGKQLNDLINEGIDKAESYEITERKDVLIYLEYVICFGSNFDTDPLFKDLQRVLKTRNLSGEEKINRFLQIKQPVQEVLL